MLLFLLKEQVLITIYKGGMVNLYDQSKLVAAFISKLSRLFFVVLDI